MIARRDLAHPMIERRTLFGVEVVERCPRHRMRIEGAAYEPEIDRARLLGQMEAVRRVLDTAARRGGECAWMSAEDIARRVKSRFGMECPETSASAQVRNLRKSANGGHQIDRRWREGTRLAEYRMGMGFGAHEHENRGKNPDRAEEADARTA